MADLRQQSYNAIDEIYNKTLVAIKRIQGDKPYIKGQDKYFERMYFIAYEDGSHNSVVEGFILGVRAIGDEIQIVGTTNKNWDNAPALYFDEEDYEFATENYDNMESLDDWEWCWQSIKGNNLIQLIPTLFSIAEVIEEYDTEE